ncbi:hypothetical protein [Methanosarcina sp. UBA5]|uniref:hypothetical protein n=1 Tax=Methanosarcina sp. UBA5 TaxID=1915593 RepID=UPI0025CFC060|nr:hypothetical protein [Methanosarcina sp. UBA5]
MIIQAGLAEIKKRSGAKVMVHASEKGCLEKGITPFLRGNMWFSKIIWNWELLDGF